MWCWAPVFSAGVLAGVAVFGIETFDIALPRESKKALSFLLGDALSVSVFALPLYAAATGSGFFDNEHGALEKIGVVFGVLVWVGSKGD